MILQNFASDVAHELTLRLDSLHERFTTMIMMLPPPPSLQAVLYTVLVVIPLLFIFGWMKLPNWTKAKRRDSQGITHLQIVGKVDCMHKERYKTFWERIQQTASQLDVLTNLVHYDGYPLLYPRMFISFIVVSLHRAILRRKWSSHDKDNILAASIVKDGKNLDGVPRETLEGLLEQIQYAMWAYPYDENYEHLEERLKEQGYELLHHDATPAPGHLAHYIAINHHHKTVLLVPRGSCALSDILTDAAGMPVMQTLGPKVPDERLQQLWSHEGILLAANALMEKRCALIEKLVTADNGYKLNIVGHSLGASVASILGALLRTKIPILNDTDRMHIYAYAPAPCINEEASQAMEPFMSTIVWNEDIIPCLSVSNYWFTLEMVADMHMEEKKYHGSWFSMPMAFIMATATAIGIKPLSLPDSRLDNMSEYALAYAKKLHADWKERESQDTSVHLYVPGKVVYLWEREHNNESTGEINGVSALGSQFLHLHVVIPTPAALRDHFLESYQQGMQQLLDQMGPTTQEHRRSIFDWEPIIKNLPA